MVVAPGSLNSTDTAVFNELVALSFTVVVTDDVSVELADAQNRDIVFISDTTNAGVLGNKLCAARSPVMVANVGLYDEMAMTDPGNNGVVANQTDIEIINGAHPIATGLSGVVSILTGNNNMGWGIPYGSADQIATIVGDPAKATVFAYDNGDNICGVPSRRVGFPLAASTGATLSGAGWTLFDNAVNWIIP